MYIEEKLKEHFSKNSNPFQIHVSKLIVVRKVADFRSQSPYNVQKTWLIDKNTLSVLLVLEGEMKLE